MKPNGTVQSFVDRKIAEKLLHLICEPWYKQQAYKLGIITSKGVPIKRYSELTTDYERHAYDVLVRLAFRLKRIIERDPIEKQKFKNYATAFALLNESTSLKTEPIDYETFFYELRESSESELTNYIHMVESYIEETKPKSFSMFIEDGGAAAGAASAPTGGADGGVPANSTGPFVAGTGDDVSGIAVDMKKKKKRPKIERRTIPEMV